MLLSHSLKTDIELRRMLRLKERISAKEQSLDSMERELQELSNTMTTQSHKFMQVGYAVELGVSKFHELLDTISSVKSNFVHEAVASGQGVPGAAQSVWGVGRFPTSPPMTGTRRYSLGEFDAWIRP